MDIKIENIPDSVVEDTLEILFKIYKAQIKNDLIESAESIHEVQENTICNRSMMVTTINDEICIPFDLSTFHIYNWGDGKYGIDSALYGILCLYNNRESAEKEIQDMVNAYISGETLFTLCGDTSEIFS